MIRRSLVAGDTGGNGTFNLNGGLLILPALARGSGTEAFNFNGGTLQASSSFSTSLPMTLGISGGGATFDTAGYSVTLSGSLSGPGSLTKVDSGTLTLAVANTFNGNTLIGGGMLALGSPLALQQSTLDSSGSLGANTNGTVDGYPATLSLQNNDLVLTVVPEPGSLALLLVGMVALGIWRLRRKA